MLVKGVLVSCVFLSSTELTGIDCIGQTWPCLRQGLMINLTSCTSPSSHDDIKCKFTLCFLNTNKRRRFKINVLMTSTHWGRLEHLCVRKLDPRWFRKWSVACSLPCRHCLNEPVLNYYHSKPSNIQNTITFGTENTFPKMSSAQKSTNMLRRQCVNP